MMEQKEAKQPSELQNAVNNLQKSNLMLDEILEMLERRLGSVLAPPLEPLEIRAVSSETDRVPTREHSSIVQEIRSVEHSIIVKHSKIDALLRNLDV